MANLLVVDDDADLAETLTMLLEADGHEVRLARNGQEGLRLIAEHQPELVLLDIEMPVLTGPDMAYRMFLHDVGQEEIPIVLLSGVMNLLRVATIVGTPYYLAKPYTFESISRMVARVLAERRAPMRTQPRAEPEPNH